MNTCPRYNVNQQVPYGTIEAVKPEGESVMYLINGEWYSEAQIKQAIIDEYYGRNQWARPGAKYQHRSFVTGHYR